MSTQGGVGAVLQKKARLHYRLTKASFVWIVAAQEARWARSSLAPAEMWPVVASVARKALPD